MKMNGFAYAVKNKPNQTQLQTNHPIFKISLKNSLFFNFLIILLPYFYVFRPLRSSIEHRLRCAGQVAGQARRRLRFVRNAG
jgi:hypothetical protein